MPEEHRGQLGFEYAWKELLRRARTTGEQMPAWFCTSPITKRTTLGLGTLHVTESGIYDRHLFAAVWKPIISAVAFAFAHFHDEGTLERAIGSFRRCGTLANAFGLSDALDYNVQLLSRITGLASMPQTTTIPLRTVDYEGQSLTVSPVSIRFGRNLKAQLAAVVLFTVANEGAAAIQQGWLQVRRF
jgi:brefeldin A-resistance guanine nucleotide exchange factor 1